MAAPEAAERALVEQAKTDPEAFGRLYDQYFQRIYSYIYRRVNDRETAEDLTEDTFMKALGAIKTYRDEGLPFAAWLFRIAGNLVTDHYRRHRPVMVIDDDLPLADPGESPEESALRTDSRNEVARALKHLTREQQDVVLLRFGDGLRLKEIADMQGKSEGAIKALMFRALHSLRGKLQESGVRP